MSKELAFPGIATILSLLVYYAFGILVGRARGKYKIPAPQTSGNPDFERVVRVHLNTLEQLVLYLPALWLFALTVSPVWAAGLGGLWILGRIIYAVGYYQAAEKRGPGFGVTALATAILLLGSLAKLVMLVASGA